MTREGHLPRGRKNPDARCAVRSSCRAHEGRLGQIQLFGDFLHARIIDSGGIWEDRKLVPFQRLGCENVHDAITIETKTIHGYATSAINSISTQAPNGIWVTPKALRAWAPRVTN